MSSSSLLVPDTLADGVAVLANQIDAIVSGSANETVTDATITKLLTAAALLYAARIESGGDNIAATARGALNATQGMMVTTGIMKSVNLQVFELGLWQTWSQEAVTQ
jgi:hypothetical protein